MSEINMLPDPVSDRRLIDSLAEDLIGTSHYHHMPGMRVWDMHASYWTRLGDAYTLWVSRAQCTIPDLLDHATIGCLMQQAWRIVERDKELAVGKKHYPPYGLPYVLTADMVMNNVDPPPSVSHWCEALRMFALNGLTDPGGLQNLVDVFKCVDGKSDAHKG
jgi:hypothetical protein